MQDVIMLQSESTMKAALGKNVKVSLPEAFQTNKVQTKSLAIKGVPTDITDTEFLEFLDLNKTNYAKAERLKSKKTVGFSRLEINDPTEAEALLSQKNKKKAGMILNGCTDRKNTNPLKNINLCRQTNAIVWIRTLDSKANTAAKVGFCVRYFISRNFPIILFLTKSRDYGLLNLL